jgi:hypothetical protein
MRTAVAAGLAAPALIPTTEVPNQLSTARVPLVSLVVALREAF